MPQREPSETRILTVAGEHLRKFGLKRFTVVAVAAAAEPHELYRANKGREAFEFDRTVSRLIEMRSEEYLAMPHGRPDSTASGDTTGLVET